MPLQAVHYFFKRPALFALLLVLCVMSASVVYAEAPVPKPPKGKGEQCVEETDFMRKNHMELLLHQRDETMYRGIRTKKHSFKECISCHVVNGDDGKPVNASNPKHFCSQCHNYASVRIDCFECHASKPRAAKRKPQPLSAQAVKHDTQSADPQIEAIPNVDSRL